MPPKKPAVDKVMSPSSGDLESHEEKLEENDSDVKVCAPSRKGTHPPTMIMIKEALNELDSRKGVSSQAIRNSIKQKYPTVDLVRMKYAVRKALMKGIENGTLVRPANSTISSGLQGRFRLAPKKNKKPKSKTENSDPNVAKPKATKVGAKKQKDSETESGTGKRKNTAKKQNETSETAKKTNTEGAAKSKVAAAKKPKAKTTAEGAATSKVAATKKAKAKKAAENDEGVSDQVKSKAKPSKATKEKPSSAKADKAVGDDGKEQATTTGRGRRVKKQTK